MKSPFKLPPRVPFKEYIKIPAFGVGLMVSGILVGLVGVSVGGQFGTPLVIIGLAMAAIGGFILAPSAY